MIIVKLQGGLGNQLFQYAIGLDLSIKKNTNVVFDLSLFDNDFRTYKLKCFNSEIKLISKVKFNVISSKYLNFIFNLINEDLSFEIINDPIWKFVDFHNGNFGKNIILNGFWSFNDYFLESRKIISKSINLLPQYLNLNYLEVKAKIDSKESVAIHVRRGDYISVKGNYDFFGVLNLDYYKESVNLIKTKVNNPYFFLFTDDVNWVKEHFDFLNDFLIVSEVQNLEDFHEFQLMRNCRHQIIANSTFSWWAAFLNDFSERVIIQPFRWYSSDMAQKVYEDFKFLYIKNAFRV